MSGCWLAAIWHLTGDFMDASWKRLDCRILIDISPRFRSRLIHDSSNRHFENTCTCLPRRIILFFKIRVAKEYALCNFLKNVSCYTDLYTWLFFLKNVSCYTDLYTWLLKSITAVPLVVSFNEFKCLKFTGN